MSKKICCASLNCDNNVEDTPKTLFHPFPDDEVRCKQWILQCRRHDLLTEDPSYLHTNFWLCGDHFSDEAYYLTSHTTHRPQGSVRNVSTELKHVGIPTIFSDVMVPPQQEQRPPQKKYQPREKRRTCRVSSPDLAIKVEDPLLTEQTCDNAMPYFGTENSFENVWIKEEPNFVFSGSSPSNIRPSSPPAQSVKVGESPGESVEITVAPVSRKRKSPLTAESSAAVGVCTRKNKKTIEAEVVENSLKQIQKQPPKGKKCKMEPLPWKEGNFVADPFMIKFSGSDELTREIKDLNTPYEFFSFFFIESLKEKIVHESIKYSDQQNQGSVLTLDVSDLNKFLGICIYMSVCHLPNTRCYWQSETGQPLVYNSMTVKRFEEIKQYLYFNDSQTALPQTDPLHDRLHKLRPVIDALRENFLKVPMEESLSIDEQWCPTKQKLYRKQYLPLKPHKYGYKLFILSGVSGFTYNFEIYSGAENNAEERILVKEPDLGACGNIVVRLCRPVPPNCNYKIYHVNFHTNAELIAYLASEKNIHTVGTVQRNRLPGLPLPSDKKILKHDTLSTYASSIPKAKRRRFNKKTTNSKEVECPAVVSIYNKHMDGVNLLDSLMARYRIMIKSKKWYFKLFFHLLDLSIVNAWLLYRRSNFNSTEKCLTLYQFRLEVSKTLCQIDVLTPCTRGRPSTKSEEAQVKKVGRAAPTVPQDVRTDQIGHFPVFRNDRNRCRLAGCRSKSSVYCEKCDVCLCLVKERNCFAKFHR